MKRTAEGIAAAAGATAVFERNEGYPVTWNDPALTERMTPSLKRVAAGTFNPNAQPTTTSEDFSFYGQKVPALYFFLGVASKGADPAAWAAAIRGVEDAARGGANIMPALVEAAKAYATVGEISNVLRAAWGEHRELVTV